MWNVNSNSYAIYRMMPFPLTLNENDSRVILVNVKELENGIQDTAMVTMAD